MASLIFSNCLICRYIAGFKKQENQPKPADLNYLSLRLVVLCQIGKSYSQWRRQGQAQQLWSCSCKEGREKSFAMLLQQSCCEHDTSKAFSYEISKNKAAELGFCCVVVLLHSKEIQEHLSMVKMLPSYCRILVEDIRHCQQTVIRLSIHTVPLKLFCSCCQIS